MRDDDDDDDDLWMVLKDHGLALARAQGKCNLSVSFSHFAKIQEYWKVQVG